MRGVVEERVVRGVDSRVGSSVDAWSLRLFDFLKILVLFRFPKQSNLRSSRLRQRVRLPLVLLYFECFGVAKTIWGQVDLVLLQSGSSKKPSQSVLAVNEIESSHSCLGEAIGVSR